MDTTLHASAGCSMMVGSSHGRQKGSTPVPPDEVGAEPSGRAGQWKPGIEPGGNRGPGCPGLRKRQGTGVPGSVRLTMGCPWRAL